MNFGIIIGSLLFHVLSIYIRQISSIFSKFYYNIVNIVQFNYIINSFFISENFYLSEENIFLLTTIRTSDELSESQFTFF